MGSLYKEVLFNLWCKTCKHWGTYECIDPCNECLGHPMNIESTKPIHYKESEAKRNERECLRTDR